MFLLRCKALIAVVFYPMSNYSRDEWKKAKKNDEQTQYISGYNAVILIDDVIDLV